MPCKRQRTLAPPSRRRPRLTPRSRYLLHQVGFCRRQGLCARRRARSTLPRSLSSQKSWALRAGGRAACSSSCVGAAFAPQPRCPTRRFQPPGGKTAPHPSASLLATPHRFHPALELLATPSSSHCQDVSLPQTHLISSGCEPTTVVHLDSLRVHTKSSPSRARGAVSHLLQREAGACGGLAPNAPKGRNG